LLVRRGSIFLEKTKRSEPQLHFRTANLHLRFEPSWGHGFSPEKLLSSRSLLCPRSHPERPCSATPSATTPRRPVVQPTHFPDPTHGGLFQGGRVRDFVCLLGGLPGGPCGLQWTCLGPWLKPNMVWDRGLKRTSLGPWVKTDMFGAVN
jgi:hypothetical protein